LLFQGHVLSFQPSLRVDVGTRGGTVTISSKSAMALFLDVEKACWGTSPRGEQAQEIKGFQECT
jgi:hypothetical protein